MIMKTLSIALLALALVACGGPAAPGAPTLADPVRVTITGESPLSQLSFTVAANQSAGTAMTLAVPQSSLTLLANRGGGEIVSLSLPVPDVDVPPEDIPPEGLRLRHISLSAARVTATVVEAAPELLVLRAHLPLTVAWSMVLGDGSLYRLGDLHTEPLDLDVRVARDRGQTLATVHATCPGTCWSVDGLAQLSDARLFVQADAIVSSAN
jgi:hypothetical protein